MIDDINGIRNQYLRDYILLLYNLYISFSKRKREKVLTKDEREHSQLDATRHIVSFVNIYIVHRIVETTATKSDYIIYIQTERNENYPPHYPPCFRIQVEFIDSVLL
jgi:hypothetical protein